MWRAKAVGERIEIVTIHVRSFEHTRGSRKLRRRQAEIAEDFVGEPFGKFAVEALDEGHALLAADVAGANFLRRVVRGAADAELNEGRVVVEVIDAIVNAVVFTVCTRCAFRRGLKSAVL